MAEVNVPQHVGIIMDGNGRWAKKRGLPRSFGHKQGAAVFKKTINWARELGVKCVTFYAFSTENWKRPADEVEGIMNLLRQYIKDIRAAAREDIRFIFLGNITRLPEDITAELLDIQQSTVNNTGFIAGVALNYGGRDEITRAARELAREAASGGISPDDITEDSIEKLLYTVKFSDLAGGLCGVRFYGRALAGFHKKTSGIRNTNLQRQGQALWRGVVSEEGFAYGCETDLRCCWNSTGSRNSDS